MQHKSRRIFQWFNLALLISVLLLFCWLALLFIRYPSSHQQFVLGWILLVLCALPLGSLVWWAINCRRSGGAA
jgi:FtsH-binding integral membrane protein